MMVVPLKAVSNQTLAVSLARQPAQIALRQNGSNIYFSLSVNNSPIVRTRIVRDRQRLLLDMAYKGFIGDFIVVDTQGADDPVYDGLGTRFVMYYLAAGE